MCVVRVCVCGWGVCVCGWGGGGGMGEGDNFVIRKALIGDAYIHHSMLCQRGQSLMKLHNSNYGAP